MPRPDKNKDIASIRRQAAKGGLTCEAYLPPALAEWVIGLIEHEVAIAPATPATTRSTRARRAR